jgi:cytochrome c-type biogenesis protein CcmE
MKPQRKKRLIHVIVGVLASATVVGLVLYASEKNMNAFFTPTQISQGEAPLDKIIRIGGLVKEGTVEHIKHDDARLETRFVVTDKKSEFTITYNKVLPDLFREGQGIVAEGQVNAEGIFEAVNVLAKHDEEYKAPEVLDALEQAGHPIKSEDKKDQSGDHSKEYSKDY